MTYRAWICEGCGRGQRFRDDIWDCPGCGKEGCDDCFWKLAHCLACCAGKTDEELRLAANAKGYDFIEAEEYLKLYSARATLQQRLRDLEGALRQLASEFKAAGGPTALSKAWAFGEAADRVAALLSSPSPAQKEQD